MIQDRLVGPSDLNVSVILPEVVVPAECMEEITKTVLYRPRREKSN